MQGFSSDVLGDAEKKLDLQEYSRWKSFSHRTLSSFLFAADMCLCCGDGPGCLPLDDAWAFFLPIFVYYLTALSWHPFAVRCIIVRNARRLRRPARTNSFRRNENSTYGPPACDAGVEIYARHNLQKTRARRSPRAAAPVGSPRRTLLIFQFLPGVTYFRGYFPAGSPSIIRVPSELHSRDESEMHTRPAVETTRISTPSMQIGAQSLRQKFMIVHNNKLNRCETNSVT